MDLRVLSVTAGFSVAYWPTPPKSGGGLDTPVLALVNVRDTAQMFHHMGVSIQPADAGCSYVSYTCHIGVAVTCRASSIFGRLMVYVLMMTSRF